jgi:adenosylcobinamide-phosphate synthase
MTAGTLIAAVVLDVSCGDPRWLPHPVRLMGRMITWYERGIRYLVSGRTGEVVAGMVLAVGLPAVWYAASYWLLELCLAAHDIIGKLTEVLLAYTALAARDLSDHAVVVGRALDAQSLDEARGAVAHIVGRDTAGLSEPEIVRATVETIAESTLDGVIAPLFYLVIGGPPLALAYKAVNTLDSMVGHVDEPYRYFGWASARLDDLANWIPARVTACLVIAAVGLRFRSVARMRYAWTVFRRDAGKHPSPNSGRAEAAMAGGLQIQLGGVNYYGGAPMPRPLLGVAEQPLISPRIREAVSIMWLTSFLGAGVGVYLLS